MRNRGSSTTLPTIVMYVSFIADLLSVDPVLMSGGPVLGVLPANRATGPARRVAWHLWTTDQPVDRRAGQCRMAVLPAENVPVCRRRGTNHAPEVMAQHRGGTEPATAGDHLDGIVPCLQERARMADPLLGEPQMRRRARLGPEPSGEGALAHRGPRRHRRHRMITVQLARQSRPGAAPA